MLGNNSDVDTQVDLEQQYPRGHGMTRDTATDHAKERKAFIVKCTSTSGGYKKRKPPGRSFAARYFWLLTTKERNHAQKTTLIRTRYRNFWMYLARRCSFVVMTGGCCSVRWRWAGLGWNVNPVSFRPGQLIGSTRAVPTRRFLPRPHGPVENRIEFFFMLTKV